MLCLLREICIIIFMSNAEDLLFQQICIIPHHHLYYTYVFACNKCWLYELVCCQHNNLQTHGTVVTVSCGGSSGLIKMYPKCSDAQDELVHQSICSTARRWRCLISSYQQSWFNAWADDNLKASLSVISLTTVELWASFLKYRPWMCKGPIFIRGRLLTKACLFIYLSI